MIRHEADPVSGALRALRISGAVLLCEGYAGSWTIAVPGGERLGALLQTRSRTTAIPFHLVLDGTVQVRPADGVERTLERGDAVVSLAAEPHAIGHGHASATPLASLLGPEANKPGGAGAPDVQLLCGAFFLDDAPFNPLLASLPSWLHVRPTAAQREQLLAEVTRSRPGSDYVVSRLLELLLADAMRDAYERTGVPAVGPLRGLRDETIGAALSVVHQAPADHWSVERLASVAGLSPSRFRARFRDTVGQGPIAYVTQLRLDIASGLLRDTDARVSEIATAVGYDSLAAFSRAFKRHRGVSPASWRTGATAS